MATIQVIPWAIIEVRPGLFAKYCTHQETISGRPEQVYLRDDSQIGFATGNVFCTFGGGLYKNVSQILEIIEFFKQRKYRKNLVSKEEYYRQHNFKPNKSFKLSVGNYIPDCRSTPFT